MNKYTQTIVDLERAQAAPRGVEIAIGGAVALCAVVALVLVLFTV